MRNYKKKIIKSYSLIKLKNYKNIKKEREINNKGYSEKQIPESDT